jgi:hypothetical protein
MIFLLVAILVSIFAIALSWAAPKGQGRLWLTAVVFLMLIALAGVFWGNYYAVPSLSRLLLYFGGLTGPVIIIPTLMLSRSTTSKSTMAKAIPTAFIGACLGFVCGFVFVVYGLGVW